MRLADDRRERIAEEPRAVVDGYDDTDESCDARTLQSLTVTDASIATLLTDHPFGDDEPLLLTIDRSITAGEARASARATAEQLRAIGVARGNAVAVALPNGPEFVITMFGVWLAGAVLVPMNPRFPETEVERGIGGHARRPKFT